MDGICSTGLNMLFTLQESYDVTPTQRVEPGANTSHVICIHCHVTTHTREIRERERMSINHFILTDASDASSPRATPAANISISPGSQHEGAQVSQRPGLTSSHGHC
jgi:hypothetical protein